MKAYDSKTLLNKSIREKAKYWFANNLITGGQYNTIINNYKGDFYTPNIFVKIGLFIFTCFIILASLGVYSLFFAQAFSSSEFAFFSFTCLFFSVGCIGGLELFIKEKKIYNSGTDEALLYSGLVFLFCGFYFITNDYLNDNSLLLMFICLPVLVASTYRYADRIVTLSLLLCFYSIVFLLTIKIGDVAKLILPFLFMIVSGSIYLITKKIKDNDTYFYWKKCTVVAQYFSLLALYASGNYYVIRETSIDFFNLAIDENNDIPLAFLFYIFTATIPILYIYFGLKRKYKTLLWIGLLLLAVSVITFKYYFSLGAPEITLTVSGIILIIVAYLAINYFKIPKHGITFKEEIDEDSFLKTNAEALIILNSLSSQTASSQENDVTFGEGKSGGAGSGGAF